MPIDDDWLKKIGPWVGGGLLGAFLLQNHHDEKRKSQAEKDDLDSCRELCDIVGEVLARSMGA